MGLGMRSVTSRLQCGVLLCGAACHKRERRQTSLGSSVLSLLRGALAYSPATSAAPCDTRCLQGWQRLRGRLGGLSDGQAGLKLRWSQYKTILLMLACLCPCWTVLCLMQQLCSVRACARHWMPTNVRDRACNRAGQLFSPVPLVHFLKRPCCPVCLRASKCGRLRSVASLCGDSCSSCSRWLLLACDSLHRPTAWCLPSSLLTHLCLHTCPLNSTDASSMTGDWSLVTWLHYLCYIAARLRTQHMFTTIG